MIEAALVVARFLLLAVLTLFLWQLYRLLARDLEATRPSRPATVPTLVALAGSGMAEPGRRYALDVELVIGRQPECAIRLDDEFCSGRHARLFAAGERCFVEDLGSTNGTNLNGQRLAANQPVELTGSDRLEIGRAAFRFER